MRTIMLALLSAGAVLIGSSCADATDTLATRAWVNKRLDARSTTLRSEFALAGPLHAELDRNEELVLAHVGDHLEIVAVCFTAVDVFGGAFVLSDEDFGLVKRDGDGIATDGVGFLVRDDTEAIDHPTRDGDLFAIGEVGDRYVAMANAGEVFSLGRFTVIFERQDNHACEVTVSVNFATNGSTVTMFPNGRSPVPLELNEDGDLADPGFWFDRRTVAQVF